MPRVKWALAVVVSGLSAFLTVLILTSTESERVDTEAELARVDFGRPLVWVTQDQSALDPPFPYDVVPTSPQENPTDVQAAPLVANVLIFWTPLLVLVLAVMLWLGGRSRRRQVSSAAEGP